ncbi:repair family protein [Mycobacterium avium subsp. avium 2285 (R)]|nr:repair family protein [Mycobacterium avium subsp. avium 2285 (R)]
MRTARLLAVLAALLTVGLSAGLLAPPAGAQPPLRLSDYLTDTAGVLSDSGRKAITTAVDKLYTDRHIRLWVVYVDTFSGQTATRWAQDTLRTSDLGDYDALLAVATTDRAYAFLVPPTIRGVNQSRVDALRHNKIEPALHDGDWSGAAVAAATGLDTAPGSSGRVILLATLAALLVAVMGLLLVMRYRGRRRGPPHWPRRAASTPPTSTRWPRCRCRHSTTCPARWWSTSTTRCAPAPTNWTWPSPNSATSAPNRSPRPSPTPKPLSPKRLRCASNWMTACRRHPRSAASCSPR